MSGLTCLFVLERVTGIEPALSAWESVQSGPSIWPDLRSGLSVSDHESPRFTLVNGPLMARRLDHVEGRPSAFRTGQIPSCHGSCVRCRLPLVGAVAVSVAPGGARRLVHWRPGGGHHFRGCTGARSVLLPAQTRPANELSAWESDRSWSMKPLSSPVWRPAVAVIDRLSPWLIAR
jgi:hypothetical protein